ncbi:SAV_2336 N-terminal domain-related protein [Streptomyces sp. NPDC050803]|uniref:SAV_2336 N-terminal domain-related protein n=1 Tax=unclassified Streptomyces TaxID=2593676 RepID=UPI0034331AE1
MIEGLLAAFAEGGPEVGAEEIADILWLAARVDAAAAPAGDAEPPEPDLPSAGHEPSEPAPARSEPEAQLFPAGGGGAGHEGERTEGQWGVPLRVPRAATLHNPLALMRTLRPIGRRAIGGDGDLLDEQATVERSVEQRLLSPVLLPSETSWLDLAVVVDAHHSMLLWADLVDELCRLMTRSGVFRDVRTWYLSGTEAGGAPMVSHRRGGAPRSPAEIADPSGHRLILVVTDTVAEGWRGGKLHDVLGHWSGHNSVAVLNVLPERLWTRAAVSPVSLRLRADRPATPTRSWHREAAAPRSRRRARDEVAGRLPTVVPMISASPRGLLRLARLTAGDGGWHRLACLRLDPTGETKAAGRAEAAVPGGLAAVEQFRSGASPTAQQLAAYLAAVPLTLPVMTLVRRSLLPDSEHGHLAEVALGGLFEPWSADAVPDELTFDFLPGVRDVLLGSQRRSDVATVRETVRESVWEYLARNRGAVREFSATQVVRGGDGRRRVGEGQEAFAERRGIAGADRGGLYGRLVTVTTEGPDGATGAGLLLTPRLVLTAVWAPTAVVAHRDGRAAAAQAVWRGSLTAALLLAEQDLLDAQTWERLTPTRLRWRDTPQGELLSVCIDAFSEVGDPVELGGVTRAKRHLLDVEFTEPHPTTGWPQLRGAPISHNGALVGVVAIQEARGQEPVAVPARELLAEVGFRAVLDQYMEPPYTLEQTDEGLGQPTGLPLYLAVDIEPWAGGSRVESADWEREAAAVVAGLLGGAFTTWGVRPDVMAVLDSPVAMRDLGRFLTEVGPAVAAALPDAPLRIGVVVTSGQFENGPNGPVGEAVDRADLLRAEYLSSLRRERGQLLVVSSEVLRQIADQHGAQWADMFGALGDAEPRGFYYAGDVESLGRELRLGNRHWTRCGILVGESYLGCNGRSLPAFGRCLAHLSRGELAYFLDTLGPGASVDFSGTTFSRELLEQLRAALRDPEDGHLRLGHAVFDRAVFSGGCNFGRAEFTDEASFHGARFLGDAPFYGAAFRREASFESASFAGTADFESCRFHEAVSYDHSSFADEAKWRSARFDGPCSFRSVSFEGPVSFEGVRFEREVAFDHSTSAGPPYFDGSRFQQPISLEGATGFTVRQPDLRELVTEARAVIFDIDVLHWAQTPTPYADTLLDTWTDRRTRLAVITDYPALVTRRYLAGRGLAGVSRSHVYGRDPDRPAHELATDSIRRAVGDLGVPAQDTLMISSRPADVTASREAGISFLGYARDEEQVEQLHAAGAPVVVTSLEPLLALLRDLG